MGVVYYKQNKNILEPHLSWEGMRLVYVSFNDSKCSHSHWIMVRFR